MNDLNKAASPCLCEGRLKTQEPPTLPQMRYMRRLLEEHGARIERLEDRVKDFIRLVETLLH